MSSTENYRPFDLEGRPFKGNDRLRNVVQVQFRTNYLKHDADAQQLQLLPGEEVICTTDKGPVIAQITGHVHRKVVQDHEIPRVLRKATDHDIKQADRNEELEREAYVFGLQRIQARDLPMKLVRAQYMQDGSRIVFYFSADGRIDFRDLVRDLAHRFRTRIEMHQIGVRDGAQMIGGIGPCGRELCCSTFLESFAPVSIRMAKDQGLTLNPAKVSGMCGRLMCCLVYEQQLYRRMRKRLPRAGKTVRTPDGVGTVKDIDPINQRVTVILEDSNRKTFDNDQVMLHDPNDPGQKVDASAESSQNWDSLESDSNSDKSRRGRRRSNKGGSASGESPKNDDGESKNRRRRRRKKKPSSDGDKS